MVEEKAQMNMHLYTLGIQYMKAKEIPQDILAKQKLIISFYIFIVNFHQSQD